MTHLLLRLKSRPGRSIKPFTLVMLATRIVLQGTGGCEPPESLQPLLGLIDSMTTLAFLAGVSLGVLGFSIGGVMFMMPGEDWTRRGKKLARHVLVGVILLLAAPMVIDYLVSSLGDEAFCTEPEGGQ